MNYFAYDNAWQLALAKSFLDPFYVSRGWTVERYVGDHPMQRLHVDVTIRKPPLFEHIDEKMYKGRMDGKPATMAIIETMSCTIPGREHLGWAAKDIPRATTKLLICCADTTNVSEGGRYVGHLDCLWIPFDPLLKWFWEHKHENRWVEFDNLQGKKGLASKVPIREIQDNVEGFARFNIYPPQLRRI